MQNLSPRFNAGSTATCLLIYTEPLRRQQHIGQNGASKSLSEVVPQRHERSPRHAKRWMAHRVFD